MPLTYWGIFVLLIQLTASAQAWAQSTAFNSAPAAPPFAKLPQMESQMYGHAYVTQSLTERVERLEKSIFGITQPGPLEMRMVRLQKIMDDKHLAEQTAEQEPIIAYLEEKMFQRTFSPQAMPQRLHRLEVQVFGSAFENYPLNIRMKKLTYAMPIVAKQIRLTQSTQVKGSAIKQDRVIASTRPIRMESSTTEPAQEEQGLLDASKPTITPTADVVHPQANVALAAEDYNHAVYRNQKGLLLRWATQPVSIYIKGNPDEVAASEQALKAWQTALRLQQVASAAEADVIINWEPASWMQSTAGIISRPLVQVDNNQAIRTVILVSMFPFQGLPPQQQLRAVSHQLGHALGIWGHSEHPSDLMYPLLKEEGADFPARWRRAQSANQPPVPTHSIAPSVEPGVSSLMPSPRDIQTLKALYQSPADSLKDYSPY